MVFEWNHPYNKFGLLKDWQKNNWKEITKFSRFENWNSESDPAQPECVESRNSCAYLNTQDGMWYTANCGDLEAFACEERF